jgi:glutathione peroxidase
MHRSRLCGFIIDCRDAGLDEAAGFWSAALGMPARALAGEEGSKYRRLADPQDELHVEVQIVDHESRVHLDIETDDIEAEVVRLEALGATRVARIQTWYVMQAPTGQRFCVVRSSSARFDERANVWPDSDLKPQAQGAFMTTSLYDIPLKKIDGKAASLKDYRGQVLLVVNVASKCGLTPQYAGLERLYKHKHAQGLEVLGFPANNFKGQEPGSDAEIAAFCATNYQVDFPLFSKISVLGSDQHPLYAKLTAAQPTAVGEGPMRERLKGYGVDPVNKADVLWNFEKFLLNRRGEVVARFAPDVPADDPRLVSAVEAELAKSA